MSAVTIYDSFDAAVYRPPSRQPPTAHVSGETTQNCEPPRFLLAVHVDKWVSTANTVLQENEGFLRSEYLPRREEGAIFETEGDVVANATLELNYPVHIALRQDTPEIRHASEVSVSSISRADKTYFRQLEGGQRETFAVLEYKNVSVIPPQEFRKGTATTERDFIRSVNSSKPAFQKGNSTILLKQSVHYSWAFDTPFVALFDMRTLVLLVFACREEKLGGDYAYVTVIDNPRLMRKALLGFLKFAAHVKNMSQERWLPEIQSSDHFKWLSPTGRAATRPSSSRVASQAEQS
ncbi:hypothetical protein ACHAQJ_001259 [Trichoderma viride]